MYKLLRIKLVLLGDTRVGKSSTIVRYVENKFDEYNCPPTIGASFLTKTVILKESTVILQIWDTAGQEAFKSLVPIYYKGAHAAVVVYDITNTESFENSKKWVEELQTSGQKDVVIALAGNKLDLEGFREVQKVNAQTFAKDQGFIFGETSAKTGENIQDLFRLIAEKAQRINADKMETVVVDIDSLETKKNNRCC